jgi:MprA protease rhombosortase-interaction domain-containing protein
MSPRRLFSTTAFAFALAATAPGTALGMPLLDSSAGSSKPAVPVTIVREVPSDGPEQTLAVVLSGAALLVAAGSAGYARNSVRRSRPA